MSDYKADVGVFGGSGFYSLIENAVEIEVDTPYGRPSDAIAVGEIGGKRVAFLARHGKDHRYPPHMIPYLANVWAMKSLGVKRIIAPSAVGSLQKHVKPGDFVVCDQFVDRTRGRKDTYFDNEAVHVSTADPYCPDLRRLAVQVIREQGISVHERGTNVVIQGPRFSTRAESKWFTGMGWEVISMTQYPEVVLAIEQEMCYVNIALVTDYDAGLVGEPGTEPVTAEEVIRVFKENNERLKTVIVKMIERMTLEPDCGCSSSLAKARL
jgi:5'-methylthioadenosine phosphorylase